MMTKNIYTFLLAILGMTASLQAQSYIMDGSPINDCGGFFLDSGGSSGGYGPNENFTTVICPDGTSGTHIQLIFSGVDITAGDVLCFFDGDNVSAPTLGCHTDFTPGAPFIIQATAANPGGCLTFTFNSDGAGEDNGWSADINCVPACQTIIATLTSTDPAVMPVDTGWIDICPGDGVFFEGAGLYPQNGVVYNHSDLTSAFSWNFGDGSISQGPTAFHTFDEPGGYIVQMQIEDQFGCKNTNFISQRVRVSSYPSFDLASEVTGTICGGDTINLAASVSIIDSTSDVSVTPNSGSFQTSGVLSDSLFLPDGNGTCYETSIFFSDFSPGQVLTDINNLLSICVIMEHSYMGDMVISLSCPDGTQIILQDQGGGGTYLGEPIDNDLNLNPGVGYMYCWTPNAINGTWVEESAGVATLPAGDYSSFESLDNFIGCPLNGEWTIEVCDNLAIDNGYIFEWSINLSEDLYPDVEVFTNEFVDWGWEANPSIFYTSVNNDTIAAAPQNAGTANYSFYVTDDFGCTYDTVVSLPILPPTHSDCHSCEGELEALMDTSVCDGGILMLDGAVPVGLGNQNVTFESYDNIEFDNDIFPNAFPYISSTNVNSLNPAIIADATLQIESVCLDVAHGFVGDVELFLRAPNGSILELSSDNGGSGNNYTNTCFTPDAAIPITAGAPPYTGEFQAEGDWAVFNGSPLNGEWSLLVSDDLNGGGGTFIGWTITFANENNITYTWAPSPDLSCTDCPDPEVSPTTTTTSYSLETEDSFGCILNDTLEVQLLASLAAPNIICQTLPTDDLQFDWNAIVGAGGYEISLDGGMTWIPASGALSHLITAPTPGQLIEIQVRATTGTGCNALVANSSCMISACAMMIDTSITVRPTCFNTADGFVFMESTGATGVVEYTLDGAGPGDAVISEVVAGMHTVLGIDEDGCVDSITFELLAPLEVTAALTIDSIDCTGGMDGSATATGDGGAGNFNYVWNTIPAVNNPTADNLIAGTYIVTISDGNNCSIIEQVIVPDATPLTLTLVETPVICNGTGSGSATANPVGGSGIYSYQWSNGQITQTANNLIAGSYDVTVTDSKSCEIINNITVTEPPVMTLDFTMDPVACFGESSGSVIAVPGNAVEPIVYIWSNGNGTVNNDNIAVGNYCLTITDANDCIISNCVDVTEPTELTLVGSSTPTLCSDGNEGTASVLANGGTGSYVYQWPDGQNTETANNLIAGDYEVTVVDNNSCQQTLMVTVTAASAIILQTAINETSCFNTNDGTATVTATGGAGNIFVYQWDTNTGFQITPTANNLLAGDYCVTVMDNNNCTEVACVTVTAPSAIVISDPTETAVSCFGVDDGQASITVTGGSSTAYTYLWSDPNAQFSNPASMLAAGMYTVTVFDSNGCTQTESIEVTEPADLVANANSNEISCFGETNGMATATEVGGTAPFNYTWSNGQSTATAANLSAGQQTVTITDGNGCSSEATTMITEPTSEVSVTATQTFLGCFNSNESQASALAMGGTGILAYEWSNGNTTANAIALDNGSVGVTVTDANGCSTTQFLNIEEVPELTAEIITVEPACFGEASGLLGVVADGGLGASDPINYDYNYIWSTGTTLDTISNMLGGIEYAVTITDAQGCSVVETRILDQPGEMTFNLIAQDITCNGDIDGVIAVDTLNVNNGNGSYVFAWDANANNQNTQTATGLSVGNYFVTMTDGSGCTAVNNKVVAEPPMIVLNFESEDNVCSGQAVGSAVVQANGGVGSFSYDWSNGATTPAIQDLATGTLIVTVTDGNGCTIAEPVQINQPDELEGLVEGDTVTCFGDRDGRVLLEAIGGTAPYLYQFADGELNGTSIIVGIEAGTYPVLIQDVNGCEWESEVVVGSPELIEVYAGADVTIDLGEVDTLEVFIEFNIGFTDIFWSAPYLGTLMCPDSTTEQCWNPISITQNTITYEVYVVDENGCEGKDNITVFVKKERPIFVPTAFTPNGDAINSILEVHGDEDITIDLFRVYDRWGSLVYETRDFQVNDGFTGWDGNFKGKALSPGVYVWYAEASYIDGHEEIFKGQTTLIR
jgi:gliding motility-associated-like protein